MMCWHSRTKAMKFLIRGPGGPWNAPRWPTCDVQTSPPCPDALNSVKLLRAGSATKQLERPDEAILSAGEDRLKRTDGLMPNQTTGFGHVGHHQHSLSRVLLGALDRDAAV
jgi:hypothetical protein